MAEALKPPATLATPRHAARRRVHHSGALDAGHPGERHAPREAREELTHLLDVGPGGLHSAHPFHSIHPIDFAALERARSGDVIS
jgi:hypothetical protein